MSTRPPTGREPARERCPHCSHPTPPGDFCGHCGGALSAGGDARRPSAFAASPSEHLHEVAVISTLFPHLPHRHTHAFRRALLAGSAAFLLLAGLRLYAPATVVAALLLPVLYLLYLYEVEVYQHEPIPVIASTFVVGLGLGVVDALVLGPRVSAIMLSGGRLRVFLVVGLAAPITAQALMLVGPLLLLSRRHFNQALDGLAFGAMSAFGFSLGTLLVDTWPVLIGPLVGSAPPVDWGLRLLREGILVALVNASATGSITASAWLLRHGRSRASHPRPWLGLGPALGIAMATQIGLSLLSLIASDLLVLVLLWAAGAAFLLLYTRIVIHYALLEEGRDDQVEGPPSACPECGRMVPTMLFCPACGAARSAFPKRTTPAARVPA